MKTCPLCAEEIQDAAIKCKLCGEMVGKSTAEEQQAQPRQNGTEAAESQLARSSVRSLSLNKPIDKAVDSFKALAVALLILAGLLGLIWIGAQPEKPKASSKKRQPGAASKGYVDLAGRVEEGVRVYSRGGTYEGTVAIPVTTDEDGDEAIAIKRDDGTIWLLKRAAVRQGNTWFTDP